MTAKRWVLRFSLILLLHGVSHAAQEIGPVETKVKTLIRDPNSQTPVVVLETVTDKKLLPIWIDLPEARAIAIELEHVTAPRPLTHDLIRNILQALGATLQRATITDLRNGIFFAELFLHSRGQDLQIDARPSDAIAIALRMKAPIYASAQVLAKSKSVPEPSVETKESQRRLGIQTQDLSVEVAALLNIPQETGVLITDVAAGSVALAAGIQRGDVITKANDQLIQSIHDLERFIQTKKGANRITLEVMKKGKPTIIEIDLPS
jgi:bifunctional DNase/RNase